MNRSLFALAFLIGAAVITWIGAGFFDGQHSLALAITALIGAIYAVGGFEMLRFRRQTAALAQALNQIPESMPSLDAWLEKVPSSLRNAVRLRIEGERSGLPGPALTSYLVGLLVMVGMLGTFLGMVVTLNGAVSALESTTQLDTIRAGLAAPIKGLGLAFGTSVAGVAGSALLGLIAALARRERLQQSQVLDQKIATVLRAFSLTHHRQETFKALQRQSEALPDLVERLNVMAAQMERMNQQLNDNLLANQERFHTEAQNSYRELAHSVECSLKDSLAASGRLAGESIKPVVTEAMAEIAQLARTTHDSLRDSAHSQLAGLSEQFKQAATDVAGTWQQALSQHQQSNTDWLTGLNQSLAGFNQTFEQRTSTLLAAFNEAAAASRQAQAEGDQQRLELWRTTLESLATALRQEWQQAGEQTLAYQRQICATLETTARDIGEQTRASTSQLVGEASQLLNASEELARTRLATEEAWLRQHGERMDQLAQLLRTEFTALRDDEAARGDAAVARLATLQAALAEHLATLGTALEAPMTRLIETASEAPRAAAEVISQLRQEMSNTTARDNQLLDERGRIMSGLDNLLTTLNQGTAEQRAAIESLVQASSDMLQSVGSQFQSQVGEEAAKLTDIATQVTGSAVEIASLSDAFQVAIQRFGESNDKLVENLTQIQAALDNSATRSDEQLAYYVAQARELIDLSLMSQKAVLDEFRQIQPGELPQAKVG